MVLRRWRDLGVGLVNDPWLHAGLVIGAYIVHTYMFLSSDIFVWYGRWQRCMYIDAVHKKHAASA